MIKGKTAVVTGSTSGIGKAIATRMAAEGANVVLNGIEKPEDVEALRSGLETEHGIKAIYCPANMMTADGCAELIKAALDAFGSVDILVNNAGIQYVSPIEEFPDNKWDAIIALNLSSAFHTMKNAIPGMKAAGWGRIINIASAHGLVASPFKSAYVSAKHGILGLTKTAALETATNGITVNAICPGYVWTPLVEAQIPDTMKARHMTEKQVKEDVLLAAQPTKEFVLVDEIADLVSFLCSDGAKSITGTHQSIDGGWTAA